MNPNKDEMVKYEKELATAKDEDLLEFQRLTLKSRELLDLSDYDFAREFRVSRSTIKRWREGRTAPHIAVRKTVFNFLIKKTESLSRK